IGRVFGPEFVLKLYLAGAVCGSIFYLVHHAFMAPSSKNGRNPSRTPGLGASGAVNAIMLLDMFLFPKSTILVEFIIPVPAILLGIFLIGKDMLRILQGDSHISGSAHLGGAVVAAVSSESSPGSECRMRLILVGKMDKMNQAFEKVKILVGMEVEDELPAEDETSFAFLDDFNRNCTLSTKQRLHGFVICLVAGLTCTLLELFLNASLAANLVKENVDVVYGCLGGDDMRHRLREATRKILGNEELEAGCCVLTFEKLQPNLYHTEQVRNKLLTLLAIMLEFGALIWYSLSYIPFARSMVSKVMVACFDTEF
ncbi:hypothetical protein C3L33_00943, partial [Rhododendron williamsianum]